MYKNSFSLENRKENAVLSSGKFIRFENVIKKYSNFGNQLWTVALKNIGEILLKCKNNSGSVTWSLPPPSNI